MIVMIATILVIGVVLFLNFRIDSAQSRIDTLISRMSILDNRLELLNEKFNRSQL